MKFYGGFEQRVLINKTITSDVNFQGLELNINSTFHATRNRLRCLPLLFIFFGIIKERLDLIVGIEYILRSCNFSLAKYFIYINHRRSF